MIKIPFTQEDVNIAKKFTMEFDNQKVYNKIIFDDNYIGYLGELLLNKWLYKNNIWHLWNNFVKKDMDQPDFVIKGKSIDLKTSFDNKLWVQEPKFDIVIFARIVDNEFILIGFITKQRLKYLINKKKVEVIKRGYRVDYKVLIEQLKPIECLLLFNNN